MTSYSAFFSSGLLAPRSSLDVLLPKTPRSNSRDLDGHPTPRSYGGSSPIRPVSPLPPTPTMHSEPDDMDVESTLSSSSTDFARESTPTQHSVSAALAQSRHHRSASAVSASSATSNSASGVINGSAGASTTAPRTLRKRRSSLTLGTSPLTAIRSPVQNVGAALKLQRHLGGRSRSGSTTAPVDGGFPLSVHGHGGVHCVNGHGNGGAYGNGNAYGGVGMGMATESLVGRLRSGSVGSGLHYCAPPGVRGNRRHVRRTTSVPAPVPPPSAPLPALPPLPPSRPHTPVGVAFHQKNASASRQPFGFQNKMKDAQGTAGGATTAGFKGRERGMSVSAGVGRIEEEMKEN